MLELAKIENMRTQAEDLAAGKHVQSTDDLDAVEAELEQGCSSAPAKAAPEKKYGVVAVRRRGTGPPSLPIWARTASSRAVRP